MLPPQPKTARHGLGLTRLGLLLLAPLGPRGISAAGCLKEWVIRFGGAGALRGSGPQSLNAVRSRVPRRAVRSLPRGVCACSSNKVLLSSFQSGCVNSHSLCPRPTAQVPSEHTQLGDGARSA